MHQCTSTSSYMTNGIARDCTFRARSTTIAFWRTTRRTRWKKSSHLVRHRQIFIHLCDLMGWGRGTYDDGVRPSTVLSTAIVIIHSSWRECRGIVQTRSNTRSPTILSHLVSAHPQQKANHPLFSDDNAWTCVSVVKSSWLAIPEESHYLHLWFLLILLYDDASVLWDVFWQWES